LDADVATATPGNAKEKTRITPAMTVRMNWDHQAIHPNRHSEADAAAVSNATPAVAAAGVVVTSDAAAVAP